MELRSPALLNSIGVGFISRGDALCPRLFTLCLNLVAWSLSAMEGYRLSISIGTKITYPMFIDDLKLYTSSEANLNSYKT